jgi:outer membrane protein assembly factor BamB
MVLEHATSDASPDDRPVGPPPARRRRLVPPPWLWVFSALCAGGIAYAQRLGADDHEFGNILAAASGLLAISFVLGWFVFRSGYGFLPRMSLLATALLGPAIFLTLFRVEAFSGDFIPRFVYRFAPPRDAALGPHKSAEGDPVDLSPTSQDFPQFLGPARDATVSGFVLSHDWTARPPQEIWRRPIGAGCSGFVAVHGFAVTMEQRGGTELVSCYEVESGDLRWSHGIETRHESVLGGDGPRGTPTIHEGKVYALGATGKLRCLDGATGEAVWIKDLHAEFGVTPQSDLDNVAWGRAASPLVVDDLVVVPAGGPRDQPVSLVAYDRKSGHERWRGGNRQIGYASPGLAALCGVRQITIVNEDTVSGHDVKTGRTLWSHPWDGRSNLNASASQAVPLSGDRLLVSKGYACGALLLHLRRTGSEWKLAEIWREKGLLKTKLTNIAAKDGLAYGLSDGVLECVDLAAGERRWKRGRYGHGQILLVGDVLLVQAENGELAMVEANPREYVELGRFQALEGKTWNNLCMYGPYLLTRNSEVAACFRLPAK